MKLITYSAFAKSHQPGLLIDDAVYPVPFATMLQLIEAGEKGLERARRAADGKRIALADATLHAPLLRPTTLRDAYAFETHVKTANANRDREVPAEWYKFPVFYFSNPNNNYGHEDEIPCPPYTQALDYELEIAVVIGKRGINIRPEDAPGHIFGFTIFNDWSARDLQVQEMKVNFGPVKSKDFASSFGPVIVTLDELADKATNRPGVYDLEMMARVNGSRSRNCDPCPSSLRMSIKPFSFLMFVRTTSMPTPRPDRSVATSLVEKPGRKINSRISRTPMVAS